MIQLRTLYLEKFDIANIEHYKLAKFLHNDIGVISYVSEDFLSFVDRSTNIENNDNHYKVSTPYVVRNTNNVLVGMVGSLNEKKDNSVDLWYVVNPCYRGYGFGRNILSQITQYLIEERYDDIELAINSKNICSNNLAISQGYNQISENYNGKDKINVYRYFKKG